jgi:hypothetical protein
VLRAAVVQPVDLVAYRLDLVVVVLPGGEVVGRPVAGLAGGVQVACRRVAVDLGREQVLDAVAARPAEDLVRRVLVRPGGPQPGGVDQLPRVAGHLQDAAGQAGQPLARVDGRGVPVDALVVRDLRAGGRGRTVRRPRRQQPVVERDVVIDTGRARVATGHLTDHAWEGVGRDRRPGLGVVNPPSGELRERRVRVMAHEALQVGLVHPVHADQQDVLDRGSRLCGVGLGERRREHPGTRQARCCGARCRHERRAKP